MIYNIIRLILGLLFIISGWVKAIDPIGVSYKIMEYANSFSMPWLESISIPLAVALCALELFVGIMLFFKLWQRAIAYVSFIFLLYFTVVTLFLYLIPDISIKECGCFGDAFSLTNGQTFFKNIVFFTMSFIYTRKIFISHVNSSNRYYYDSTFMTSRKKKQLKSFRFTIYVFIFIFSLSIPLYSATFLPPFTYLPFNIGDSLREGDNSKTKESVVTKLLYENISTGEIKEFDIDDTEWQDDEIWRYVDTKTIGGSDKPVVDKISIFDENKDNVTDQLLDKKEYSFYVISQNIKDLNYNDINKLSNLYKLNKTGRINLVVLTASHIQEVKTVLSFYGWNDIEAYNVDLVELKSLLRNTKGLVLVDNSKISGKWNFRQSVFKSISYNDIQPLIEWEKNAIIVYYIVIGLIATIMLYLIYSYHTTRR